MEKAELLAYLQSQRLGVLGSLSPDNQPQGALVGYAITPKFEILFDTVRTSRKYSNMLANPHVSFTIGDTTNHADERTVQYEGLAEELTADQLAELRPIYYATWPDGVEREQWPDITWFIIHPRWIRYSDFNIPHIQEWTLQ
jgi:nitroimidazol reductase NimA-like FMN-containing flavoprotein (pyridoxamine 5'-phosphate oxidase superfamily)